MTFVFEYIWLLTPVYIYHDVINDHFSLFLLRKDNIFIEMYLRRYGVNVILMMIAGDTYAQVFHLM